MCAVCLSGKCGEGAAATPWTWEGVCTERWAWLPSLCYTLFTIHCSLVKYNRKKLKSETCPVIELNTGIFSPGQVKKETQYLTHSWRVRPHEVQPGLGFHSETIKMCCVIQHRTVTGNFGGLIGFRGWCCSLLVMKWKGWDHTLPSFLSVSLGFVSSPLWWNSGWNISVLVSLIGK